MNKIYKSFDDLIESNKTVFNYLLKSGQVGILRAVWEARDSEVAVIQDELAQQKAALLESNKILEEVRQSNILLQENQEQTQNMLVEAQRYAFELSEYSKKADAKLQSMQDELSQFNVRIENEKEAKELLLLEMEKVKDEYSANKAELEKSIKYLDTINDFAEKSNQLAQKNQEQVQKYKKEADLYKERFKEGEERQSHLAKNLHQLQDKLEQLAQNLETVQVESARDIQQFKADKMVAEEELKKATEELEELRMISGKAKAEASKNEVMAEQWLTKYKTAYANAEQGRMYAEELEVYVKELRDEYKVIKANLEKALENERTLKEYSLQIKNLLEREKIEHHKTGKKLSNAVNLNSNLLNEVEILKANQSRFQHILGSIESTLHSSQVSQDKNVSSSAGQF